MRVFTQLENLSLTHIRDGEKSHVRPGKPVDKSQVLSDLLRLVVERILQSNGASQGLTSWISLATLFTPSTFFAIFSALFFCFISSTLPRSVTVPSLTSTSIAPPLTTGSAASFWRIV